MKEEIKKDELTLIPAAQIDLGYTLLSGYSESGKTAMRFDKQSIQSRNLRLSIASVEELNNKKYKMKRHGKIEYQANLHRSSNIKYSYISDSSTKYDTELNSGALHNINGELGVDIIYDIKHQKYVVLEVNGIPAFATPDQEKMGINFNAKKIQCIVDLIDRKTRKQSNRSNYASTNSNVATDVNFTDFA